MRLADARRLKGRIARARERHAAPEQWAALAAEVAAATARYAARVASRPAFAYPPELPVSARAADIAAAIRAHPVVIVCGETGSGKTTQLPKICIDAGRGARGLIGHTQPRRIAARAVASRIAQEMGTPLGEAVGYKVRFTDRTKPDAWVKLMTDGILLAETQRDRWLSDYDTIIVDEAHERSLNIDFLLGYLARLVQRRRDLRVVITSATIDAERFARHFGSEGRTAPVIEVSGRTYPVEVRYRPLGGAEIAGEEADDEEALEDAIVATAEDLWREGPGDILVFLPGEREIRETADLLRKGLARRPYAAAVEVLPLYARLSVEDQQRVFAPSSGRRVVLATNVAETSITVPGIRYVIDSGLARVKRYSLRNKTTLLSLEKVSKAAAHQRAGRCGRVADGICVRLYAEADYAARGRLHRPGDPAQLARRGDPAHGRARPRCRRRLPVPRSARTARDRRRLPAAAGAGRDRRRARAHAGRARARPPAARPAHRADPARGARIGVRRRGAGDRRRARRAGPARASARTAAGGRPGAPAFPRRALGLPLAGDVVGVRRRSRQAGPVAPQAGRRLPRAVREPPAGDRVARRAPAARERARRVRVDVDGGAAARVRRRALCDAAPGAPRRPAGQRRREGRRRRGLPRHAGPALPRPSRLGPREEGTEVGRRRPSWSRRRASTPAASVASSRTGSRPPPASA